MTTSNRIVRLELATVALPDSHPRAADGGCTVDGFALVTADGVVVVDTGPRAGHPIIDELYAPIVTDVVEALTSHDVDDRDVIAVVNTHLHFDHCGQNHRLPQAPVWTTEPELRAASEPLFTVPEWATIDDKRRRLSHDGEAIATGVRLLHTPGHTPGHQSVAVETELGLELIVGQACYECGEFEAGVPAAIDAHDPPEGAASAQPPPGPTSWADVGRESVERLRSLDPMTARFSHDRRVWHRTS